MPSPSGESSHVEGVSGGADAGRTADPVRRIDLGDATVVYEVQGSGDATRPRIDVDVQGVTVVLRENSGLWAADFLREKTDWVVEKHREFERYREPVPDRTFEPAESCPVVGTDRELVVGPAGRNELRGDAIRLRRSAVGQSSVERALENFYRTLARKRFTDRADYFAPRMGVEYEQVGVRNQKTKWGSCSSTGTLGLNWRLLLAPPPISEYVVVHELAHLREMSHSEEFWAIVAQLHPS